ncbi:MAG: hypothetical protein AB7O62_24675 [Pirellulales bacterium]
MEVNTDTPQTAPRKMDPVTRARVIMAFWGFLLTGAVLVALVMLLGRMVRRRARLHIGPSRYGVAPLDSGPLPPRDPPQDSPVNRLNQDETN